MFKNEQGSVVVLSLVVVTVLSTLVIGSMHSNQNEIKIASHDENRVKAKYIAEGGMKKALQSINKDIKDGNLTPAKADKWVKNWSKIGSLGEGSYKVEISKVIPPKKSLDRIYEFKAIGEVNGTSQIVKTKVEVNNDLDDPFENTILAGGDADNPNNLTIEGEVKTGASNIPNFDFAAYKNAANQVYDDEEEDGESFEDELEDKNGEWSGGITYLNGSDEDDEELEIKLNEGILGPSPENPAVIVADCEELELNVGGKLENVYFVVKGKLKFKHKNGEHHEDGEHHSDKQIIMDNVFVYAAGNKDEGHHGEEEHGEEEHGEEEHGEEEHGEEEHGEEEHGVKGIKFNDIKNLNYSGGLMTDRDIKFDNDLSGTITHKKINIFDLYGYKDENELIKEGNFTEANIVFWK